jgi:hypothetical protein
MLHAIITAVLMLHGVGHAVGFWLPVPTWFALAWLLPGIGFLIGSWAFWQRADWWPLVVLLAALASLLLVLLTGELKAGPFASAFLFDLAVIVALVVPWSRRIMLGA